MIVTFDTKKFVNEMKNVVNYSLGFLEGAQAGKKQFMANLGQQTIELMKEYIDSSARLNPAMLHHVYEWYQTGSPEARLYDLDYTVSNLGLSIKSSFRQSTSVSQNSNVPFYDKARIMEAGITIRVSPRPGKLLKFDVNGETVFTENPVTVDNPGGPAVQGGFERIFNEFFNKYFSQAFLRNSGILKYLERPVLYNKNLSSGKIGGRSVGYPTGYTWIANAGRKQ
jgi:hypothetical protein